MAGSLRPSLLVLWTVLGIGYVGFQSPSRNEVQAWLGAYRQGPESVDIRWDGGLKLNLGRIAFPADGRWHETVPTFAVRHKALWQGEAREIHLWEQHDEGAVWRYKLRLDSSGEVLLKLAVPLEASGRETVVRRYRRQPKN